MAGGGGAGGLPTRGDERGSCRIGRFAMAITAHLCRANAEDCARQARLSIHPNASAAYQELVRAWLVLADTAEQLTKLRRVERAKPAITAKAA